MFVPVWLGYLMLTALSVFIVVFGLYILSGIATLILDEIVPRVWLFLKRSRLRGFDENGINEYLDALHDYWEEIQREENKKRGGKS